MLLPVELLQELRDLKYVSSYYNILITNISFDSSQYNTRNIAFLNHTPNNYQFTAPSLSSHSPLSYNEDLLQTRKAETLRRAAREPWDKLLMEVLTMEVRMGIVVHWQPSVVQYMETLKYMGLCKYHCALDNLQRLTRFMPFVLGQTSK